MTTIDLREHELVEARLSFAEVAALLQSRLVDVSPAWRSGYYRVKAGHIVGVVHLGDRFTIRVRPKLPVRRVIDLLSHAAELSKWEDHLVDLADDAPLDVALASAFVNASENALRLGVRNDYFGVESELHVIRGRIDVNRQLMRYGLPIPISVSYEEFGVDIPENQLILGATMRLLRIDGLPPEIRNRLRRLRSTLGEARPAKPHEANNVVHFTRLNENYRSAVALARAALEGVSFDIGSGARKFSGFTLNMNTLFEKFLEISLMRALKTVAVGVLSPKRTDHLDVARLVKVIPDLTWTVDGFPKSIIDAKYKDLENGMPSQGDLYQVVAYSIGLGVRKAYLVHATSTQRPTNLIIRSSDIEVIVTGINLAAPSEDLRVQIEALASEVAGVTAMFT